jgi:hypothetical protein
MPSSELASQSHWHVRRRVTIVETLPSLLRRTLAACEGRDSADLLQSAHTETLEVRQSMLIGASSSIARSNSATYPGQSERNHIHRSRTPSKTELPYGINFGSMYEATLATISEDGAYAMLTC